MIYVISFLLQQKLAASVDNIPVVNKSSSLDNISRETSEERTDNGADRLSSERDNSVVQNGEYESKDGQEVKYDIDKKATDLKKSESLMNGQIKEETSEHKEEIGVDKSGGIAIKTEAKDEEKDIKYRYETLENSQGSESDKSCTRPIHSDIKTEIDIKEERLTADDESFMQDRNEPKIKMEDGGKSSSCNGHLAENVEKVEQSEKSKVSSPTPPQDLPPIYDPSAFLPRLEDFELVVTSVEQLRELIKKFGDLPEPNGGGGEEGKEDQKKSKVLYQAFHVEL